MRRLRVGLGLAGMGLAGIGLVLTATGAQAQQGAATAVETAPAATGDAAVPVQAVPAQAIPAQKDAAKEAEKKPAKEAAGIVLGGPVQADTLRTQRKAAKLYLRGVKLLEKRQAEEAWTLLKQAAELEPANGTYMRAAELARQSAVTQLVQAASRESGKSPALTADSGAEPSQLLRHALELDPANATVVQHLDAMGDAAIAAPVGQSASGAAGMPEVTLSGPIELAPSAEKHTFHLHTSARQVVQEVFRTYGIDASVSDSVAGKQVRLDTEDASFAEAAHLVGLVTHTFYEALDPHRVVVADDTRANRTQYQRSAMETVYLPGLNEKEMTDVTNLARNVFDVQQVVASPTKGMLTVRASSRTLAAFNRTLTELEHGRDQVDLDVKVIQLAHTSTRDTGTTFLQQTTVANAYSEIQSILNQNQSAVQQIISSGLVPNANGLTNQLKIIGILLAAGELTGSSILTGGFALFGNGITESALGPGPATLNFSLNSSDTRTLEDIHLRLEDDEAGTLKIGERYPIETSQYSAVALTALTSAGASNQTVPQIEYEDLGLTFKATPKVMRSKDVALTLDIKISSLGGAGIDNIPILNNQQFSGVLTMREGETAILLSDLTKQETRALSGLPGVSDIPGLQDVSDINRGQNVARLLILVTPYVVRGGAQFLAHGPMLRVDKQANAH